MLNTDTLAEKLSALVKETMGDDVQYVTIVFEEHNPLEPAYVSTAGWDDTREAILKTLCMLERYE